MAQIVNLQVELDIAEQAVLVKRAELRAAIADEARTVMETKVISQRQGDSWTLWQGDCVEVAKGIPTNSVHYSLFSPPFASLFTYSNSERDMGNSKDDSNFSEHFSFLLPELWRVLKPGRLVSFHCMNLPMTIGKDGVIGIKDFRGELIRAFIQAGFIFHSEVIVWKDPLIQAVRTKMLGLAHKQISKDSTRCGMGFPDYIVTMRKSGENLEPVAHGGGFTRYIGELPEPKAKQQSDPRVNKYSHEVWQRYASPVWFDIKQTNTLNAVVAREAEDERHICPLQLQVIARCLELWTNKEDVVLDPFAGIGSTGYVALGMGRRFIGIELKNSYWKTACRNLVAVKNKAKGFDF